jgi:hypothetical protein
MCADTFGTFVGNKREELPLTPSRWNAFDPQHHTAFLVSMPQVKSVPIATEVNVCPTTSTGVTELVVVPFPNCPNRFEPQHHTAPSRSKAHECWAPTKTDFTLINGNLLGVETLVRITLPAAASDESMVPQHHNVVSIRTAHVVFPPAATLRASVIREAAKAVLRAKVSLPNCP